jgi:CRISPR system Cascade subunit CasC
MLVEIHMLQNFAPSNLNRDDTNSPKDCTFGGFRRARISSQCLKRAIRTDPGFAKSVEGRVGVRTKLVHERLVALLSEKGRAEAEARERVQRALEAVGFKWDETHTAVLLFVDDGELEAWAEVLNEQWDKLGAGSPPEEVPADEKKAKKKATAKQKKQAAAEQVPPDARKALKDVMGSANLRGVDIALFGRMVAEHTEMNVDAACQVAHAISTHAVTMEMDFFTAVDDLQPKADTGAGMMGVVEFNSACFYRYAVIDLEQLQANLTGGSSAVARAGAIAFCQSAVRAVPTGKQNGFAAQNPPDWVRVEVREATPRSLVNAFSDPVHVNQRDSDLVGQSILRAQQYALRLDGMLNDDDPLFVGTATTRPDLCPGAVKLTELWQQLENALSEKQA